MENKKYYYVFVGGADYPIECKDEDQVDLYLQTIDADMQDVTVVYGELKVLVMRVLPH